MVLFLVVTVSQCPDFPGWWGKRDGMPWHLVSLHRATLHFAESFLGVAVETADAGSARDTETGDGV